MYATHSTFIRFTHDDILAEHNSWSTRFRFWSHERIRDVLSKFHYRNSSSSEPFWFHCRGRGLIANFKIISECEYTNFPIDFMSLSQANEKKKKR